MSAFSRRSRSAALGGHHVHSIPTTTLAPHAEPRKRFSRLSTSADKSENKTLLPARMPLAFQGEHKSDGCKGK